MYELQKKKRERLSKIATNIEREFVRNLLKLVNLRWLIIKNARTIDSEKVQRIMDIYETELMSIEQIERVIKALDK